MIRSSLIFCVLLFIFPYTSRSQIALEKTTFDLGEISLLNEDIIDLQLANNTDSRLFIIRISTEDNVQVKFTSRTIQPGEMEMLRVKLNPPEVGTFKTNLQLFFGHNTEAIELDFTAEVLAIPVNQLQSCPDFSASRTSAVVVPGSYQKQEKGEIKVENVAVLNESELKDYLLVKKAAELEAIAFEQEMIRQEAVQAEAVTEEHPEEILIEYNYQSESNPEVVLPEDVEENELDEIQEEKIDLEYSYQEDFGTITEETEEIEEEQAEQEEIPESEQLVMVEEKPEENLLNNSYRPNNIVFLLDASTSMSKEGKIELLKASMKELLIPLRAIDKIAIVSYAGEASLLLASTEASDKEKIANIIDAIPADGSTNAVKGLRMALEVAKSNFIEGGNNQIILATDGAFDIGSRNDRLRNKIEKSAKEEIIISVIGIKNDQWTNKSLREIADLGGGELLRIHSERNLSVILDEVKEQSVK